MNKTTAQKMARQLQRLAEDELGIRPKLTTCHNILRDADPRLPNVPREEYLASLYMRWEHILKASAEKREETSSR